MKKEGGFEDGSICHILAGNDNLFIVLELLTIGLTSIWFAAGSIGGLIVAALGGNVFIQAAVF